jgi:TPR repeat protein
MSTRVGSGPARSRQLTRSSSIRAPASQSSGTWTAEVHLLGYDPETGEELLAVTPEIVDRWKAQQAQAARRPPRRVDPETHDFFDPKTGRPNIWHSPGENGALEFFDGPGFHPRTGKALTEITQEFANERLRDIQKRREDAERERQKREADAERERQKREADAERERQKREADAERERQKREADAERERQKREADAERERRKREAEQLEQQRQEFVRMCDELAANPNDQNRRRTSRGVSYDELKTHVTEAIQVCEVAAQQTNDLTSQYQSARAVELVDPRRGQSMQDRLVKKGYPAAFDNAGSLLLNDRGCKQHCVNEAVKLFKKGADLGDPDSMMSLADQINNGQASGNVIALYQRAAKLGHPRAIRALEALAQERMPPRLIFRFPF